MAVTVESTLEGHSVDTEAGVINGTKPLQFSGPTYGEVIHEEDATMEIICQGNEEGHEPPPAPEPEPTQEQRRRAKLIGPLFEPAELL